MFSGREVVGEARLGQAQISLLLMLSVCDGGYSCQVVGLDTDGKSWDRVGEM